MKFRDGSNSNTRMPAGGDGTGRTRDRYKSDLAQLGGFCLFLTSLIFRTVLEWNIYTTFAAALTQGLCSNQHIDVEHVVPVSSCLSRNPQNPRVPFPDDRSHS